MLGDDDEELTKYTFGDVSIQLSAIKESKEARGGTALPSRSTGGSVWPAALVLCTYLSSHPECLGNKSVLEIGAGLGLCGILAAHYSKSTVLTDNDADVLRVLDENVKRVKAKIGPIVVHKLQWAKDLEVFKEECGGPFDVILASDVLYYPSAVEQVWRTVDALLCREGQFILCHVSRDKSVDKELLQRAQERNFVPQVIAVSSLYRTKEEIPANEFINPSMLRLFIFVRGMTAC